MQKPVIVALDIGTSSVRAMGFDSRGRLLPDAEVQIPYSQRMTPDGGVETDPLSLLSKTFSAINGLLSKITVQERSRIAGVGVSCFWHSLMGVDGDGRAVTPLYSWADTRSRRQAAELRGTLDLGYHIRTGCFPHSSYWPAKLLWLKETEPERFNRVDHWMGFGEFMVLNLFGVRLQSRSMASATGLFDSLSGSWDSALLGRIGIDEKTLLPVQRVEQALSGLSASGRRRIKLPVHTPWLLPAGDGACSNVGSGAVDSSRLAINMGTSGALRAVTTSTSVSPKLFRYAINANSNIVGGALANGGNAYAWLLKTLASDPDLARSASRMAPDSHGLTVLPFWAGERSPGWHSEASAAIFGLNLHSEPADIVRATLEAITYTLDSIRVPLLEQCPEAREIVASGGALRNDPAWLQMMADVFGATVVVSREAEASCRGAALLAAESLGMLKRLSDAAPALGRRFQPDSRRHEQYKAGSARYGKLYKAYIEKEFDH